MEVTRKNFKEVLQNVLSDIKECDLIAWDGEFTGISNDAYKTMPFDTVDERYEKLRKGNMDYVMMQVGLCLFTCKNGTYIAKPYDFFVLPRPTSRHAGGPQFICQTSCLEFLASHGFDFNKVFYDGITYLNSKEEAKMRAKIISPEEVKAPNKSPIINIKQEDEEFLQDIVEKVAVYLEDTSVTEPLQLPQCTMFRRKLTYQRLEKIFPNRVEFQNVRSDTGSHINVMKIDETKTEAEREQMKQECQLDNLEVLVGFSRVIKAISASQKLIVGHNTQLDLMYMLHQFIDDLPENYDEYKAMVQTVFPKLIDTKTVASSQLFQELVPGTSLDNMLTSVTHPPFQPVPIEVSQAGGFPNYEAVKDTKKPHDAAYDAYMTGKCYLHMIKHLAAKSKKIPIDNLTSNTRLLSPFLGKIFMYGVHDIPYYNLYGEEVNPDRSDVYHMTIPSTWTKTEIFTAFKTIPIHIHWLDSTSVLISLINSKDRQKARHMLKEIRQSYKVIPYPVWRSQMASGPRAAIPVESTRTTKTVSAKRTADKSVNIESTPDPEEVPEISKKAKPSAQITETKASIEDEQIVSKKKKEEIFKEISWT